jgi:hypothetical protein
MPWSTSRPKGKRSAARYHTPEHRAAVREHHAELRALGSGTCAEPVCLAPSRVIAPGMALDLCHDRMTGAVLGLGHSKCNRSEASRYARAKQDATRIVW